MRNILAKKKTAVPLSQQGSLRRMKRPLNRGVTNTTVVVAVGDTPQLLTAAVSRCPLYCGMAINDRC